MHLSTATSARHPHFGARRNTQKAAREKRYAELGFSPEEIDMLMWDLHLMTSEEKKRRQELDLKLLDRIVQHSDQRDDGPFRTHPLHRQTAAQTRQQKRDEATDEILDTLFKKRILPLMSASLAGAIAAMPYSRAVSGLLLSAGLGGSYLSVRQAKAQVENLPEDTSQTQSSEK